MTEGTITPAAASPTDRAALLSQAEKRHDQAVVDFEQAQRAYTEAVNALPLPELMQGPVVRVTDADSIEKARTVLELADVADAEVDRLLGELRDYRAECARLAEFHGIAELAEFMAITAAAIVRAGRA